MRQNHNLCIDLKLFYSELVFMTLCFVESITVEECELLFMHEIFKHQMSVVSSVCAVPVPGPCTAARSEEVRSSHQFSLYLPSEKCEQQVNIGFQSWLKISPLPHSLSSALVLQLSDTDHADIIIVDTETEARLGWAICPSTPCCAICAIHPFCNTEFTIAGKVLKIFLKPSTLRFTVFHVSPTDWDHWEQNMSWIQDF